MREPPAPILITNGTLVLPDRLVPNAAVLLADGKVAFAGPAAGLEASKAGGAAATGPARGATSIRFDAAGGYICPALWEPHIHGAGGTWTGGESPGNLRTMARVLASEGVGIFLPTTVSDRAVIADLGRAIRTVGTEEGIEGRIPGMYVEGPFVSLAKRGGIPEECLHEVSREYLDALVAASGGTIRVMTYAPELPGAHALPAALRERGILPALGHSDARLEEIVVPAGDGPLAVTHLFNGMSGVSHRDPGLALWALLDREAYTELICDGAHVHPAALSLALKMRPAARIVAISDGVAPAGTPSGPGAPAGSATRGDVVMYGKKVTARGSGVYFEESGVLVGSRLLVRDGLARLVSMGVPVPEAVAMASVNPARLHGFPRKGSLLPGMDADAAVFAADFSRCTLSVFQGRALHGLPGTPPARTVEGK
jgi:N-acetylglucosamine-6-phosphate deacetylase